MSGWGAAASRDFLVLNGDIPAVEGSIAGSAASPRLRRVLRLRRLI